MDLSGVAEMLGLVVGLLQEIGVLWLLQTALGVMVVVISGRWLFGLLSSGR